MTKWNGSGMVALSKEKRKKIGEREAKRSQERNSGWPPSSAKLGDPDYHKKCNAEFNRRVAASKARRGIVDNLDKKLEC